jgi:hypothetical protein
MEISERRLKREEIEAMVRFYDPIDPTDQQHVEQVLRKGGIEYFLRTEPEPKLSGNQILIAEEDVAIAEQLLARARH